VDLATSLECNNYQSPNIATEWGFVTLAHQNLTGHGDFLHDGTFVGLYGGVVGL
jgi:hypothetical protein